MHLLEATSIKDIEKTLGKPLGEAKKSPLNAVRKLIDDFSKKYNDILKGKYKGKKGQEDYETSDDALTALRDEPLDKKAKKIIDDAVKYLNSENPAGTIGEYEGGLDHNIKIRGSLPEYLEEIFPGYADDTWNFTSEFAVESLIDQIKGDYAWAHKVFQAGRSGGHLIVTLDLTIREIEDLFDSLAENLDDSKTLDDLEYTWESYGGDDIETYIRIFSEDVPKLEKEVEVARKGFESEMESKDFWVEELQNNKSSQEIITSLQLYYDERMKMVTPKYTREDFIDDLERMDGKEFVKAFKKVIDLIEAT